MLYLLFSPSPFLFFFSLVTSDRTEVEETREFPKKDIVFIIKAYIRVPRIQRVFEDTRR